MFRKRLNVLSAFLAVFYLLNPSPAASQTNNEVRALWVVRTTLTSPEKIRTMVDTAANNGFNTIIIQVRGRGDAYYRSHQEPRATDLKDPEFDPLAVTLSEAKRRGLKVHAWLNTSLLANLDALPTDPNHVYNKHPEWLAVPRPIAAELYNMSPQDPRYRARIVEWSKANRAELEGVYTGPANPKVREHIYKIWMDVLNHYEVDGLHFDYIRLASPDFDYSRTSLNNFRKWLKHSGILHSGIPALRPPGTTRPPRILAVRKGGLPPLFQLSKQEHGSKWLEPPGILEPLGILAVRKGGLPPPQASVADSRGMANDVRMKSVPPRGSGSVSITFQGLKPAGSNQSMSRLLQQNPLALTEMYPAQFADFQREQITTLVQRIYREVKRRKPNVTVSAAVFANDENAYTRRFQDWRRWLSMGIIDVVCPMAYTTDTEVFKIFFNDTATTAHAAHKKVWAGIGAYRIPVESTVEKITAARSLGADGIILFSYDFTLTPSPLNPTADYLERVRHSAFERSGP